MEVMCSPELVIKPLYYSYQKHQRQQRFEKNIHGLKVYFQPPFFPVIKNMYEYNDVHSTMLTTTYREQEY